MSKELVNVNQSGFGESISSSPETVDLPASYDSRSVSSNWEQSAMMAAAGFLKRRMVLPGRALRELETQATRFFFPFTVTSMISEEKESLREVPTLYEP
jgi:hypothetical protein